MTSQAKKRSVVANPTGGGSVPETGKPPYPFRTFFAVLLLAGNFLVAAIYFHVINP